jgi:Flp pilus assembly protein TadD
MRRLLSLFFLTGTLTLGAADASKLLREAAAAEASLDVRRALELYQQADAAQPQDAFILQKIARQYSDLVVDQATNEARRDYANRALGYAERAVALAPNNAECVLSLGVCYGKLAVYSDTREKVRYSRLIKESAERALALDPNYAWAHHLLGRWHYEVADLGAAARFFVKLIYGGLPPADRAEAVRSLRRATELEPTELNHWLELGFAYAAAGQPAEARRAWEKGLAMPVRAKHDASQQRAREALAKLK